ncbi:acyltransferase [Agaricicola taiwanensis]|uniref:Acyltransferase n=1 Tax=Agaricicola taiwanensis TaxID=591372 RepID=A0A8J3DX13_9RHOB|nr:acyltransferase [Agaricicola taiwanensis]GGE44758.1 acyltransferase [Agaricicola taiwanensis]
MTLLEAIDRNTGNVPLVRLLAAIMMSVSQAFYIAIGTADSEPLLTTTGLTLWKHAFIIFFGLSGFLLLASWERHPDALRFFLARLLRILPGLIFAALLTVVLGAAFTALSLSSYADPMALGAYILRVTVLMDGQAHLPGVFGPPAPEDHVLTTLWTMKFLIAGIIGVILLGITGLFRWAFIHVAAIVALIALDLALNGAQPLITLHDAIGHGVRFGLCFALGMAAWRFRSSLPMHGRIAAAAALMTLAGMWFGGFPTLAYYVLELYVALWLAFGLRLPKTRASDTDLSYGLYLYAWPATQAWHMVAPDMSIALLAILGTATGGVLAAFSWYAVERPAMACLPRLLSRARRSSLSAA